MTALTVLAAIVLLAVAAFALMRAHGRKSAAAYDRRTGRRMIEHLVHTLIEDHDGDAPISGQILDDAWAAANEAPALYALGSVEVSRGAQAALAVYETTLQQAIDAPAISKPIPTLGDLLDSVRATSLDPRQPTTPGATR